MRLDTRHRLQTRGEIKLVIIQTDVGRSTAEPETQVGQKNYTSQIVTNIKGPFLCFTTQCPGRLPGVAINMFKRDMINALLADDLIGAMCSSMKNGQLSVKIAYRAGKHLPQG